MDSVFTLAPARRASRKPTAASTKMGAMSLTKIESSSDTSFEDQERPERRCSSGGDQRSGTDRKTVGAVTDGEPTASLRQPLT